MSYETNPTLNRIKLSKGWKTSSFPTKSLNYSRDIRVWFKLYLFLKVYLLLYGLRLLTYEVRNSNKYTKNIYLLLTILPKIKRLNSKWKNKSFLKGLKSPLSLINNKKGRFLLYLDLQTLKKKIKYFFNNTNKKLLSPAWLTKPKTQSWINSSHLIWQHRKLAKLKYKLAWKKKVPLTSRISTNKTIICLDKMILNNFLWKKKERHIFSLLTKMQKDFDLFEKYFDFIWNQMVITKNMSLFSMVMYLEQQLQKKKTVIKKLSKIYLYCQKKNLSWKPKIVKKTFVQKFQSKLKKKKMKHLQFRFWLNLNQHFGFSQKDAFFLSPVDRRFLLSNKKTFLHWQKTLLSSRQLLLLQRKIWLKKKLKPQRRLGQNCFGHKSQIFPLHVEKKKYIQVKILQKFFLKPHFTIKQKIFLPKCKRETYTRKIILKKQRQSLSYLREVSKTTFFKKAYRITFKQIFLWIRLAQKKKIIRKKTNFYKNQKKKFLLRKKQIFYRFSFRQNYRKFLTMTTHVKLKYLLQGLIKNYFKINVSVKLSWPLIQFKNLKFYRLIFPKYKMHVQNKKKISLKISKNKRWQKKKYLYIGKTTNHLKFVTPIWTKTKTNVEKSEKKKTNNKYITKITNTQQAIIFNLEKDKMKKKNKYLALKAKLINTKSEQRLAWVSKTPFIPALLTTLTLFVKYLDPQPLADHLAELIGKTKKHAELLKLVESILRTFSLKRGLGYRIALIGRINGANKSKTLYLRKLNRNRSRQNFSKKVNFALAHARALIGTFAVKIWIYT